MPDPGWLDVDGSGKRCREGGGVGSKLAAQRGDGCSVGVKKVVPGRKGFQSRLGEAVPGPGLHQAIVVRRIAGVGICGGRQPAKGRKHEITYAGRVVAKDLGHQDPELADDQRPVPVTSISHPLAHRDQVRRPVVQAVVLLDAIGALVDGEGRISAGRDAATPAGGALRQDIVVDVPHVNRHGLAVLILVGSKDQVEVLQPDGRRLYHAPDRNLTGGVLRLQKGVESVIELRVAIGLDIVLPVRLIADEPQAAGIMAGNRGQLVPGGACGAGGIFDRSIRRDADQLHEPDAGRTGRLLYNGKTVVPASVEPFHIVLLDTGSRRMPHAKTVAFVAEAGPRWWIARSRTGRQARGAQYKQRQQRR